MKTKKINIVDHLVSLSLVLIITGLSAFYVISLSQPQWLKEASETDKIKETAGMINQAIYQIRNGENQEAIAICQEVIDIIPSSAEAYINLGLAYKNLQDYDMATAAFYKALLHEKYDSSNIYNNLCDIYFAEGDTVSLLKTAILADSTNHQMINKEMTAGVLDMKLGNWKAAQVNFEKALALRHNLSVYYVNMLHRALGVYHDKPEIIRDIKKLLNQPLDNYVLSVYDLSSFRRLLESDKGLAENFNKIGFTLARQNQFHESLKFFERALSVWPLYPDAKNNIRFVREKLGKP